MSSGSSGALLTLAVVVAAGVGIDRHYWNVPGAHGGPVPIATAEDKTSTVPVQPRPAALAPVGPVPGPARSIAPSISNPLRNDAAALTEGRRLFLAFNCAGCHGDHAGGGMGPSLRDATWIYGGQPAEIYDSISSGRAHGMPSWGTIVPSEQIWQLVAYLQSLRTPQEPEPPQ